MKYQISLSNVLTMIVTVAVLAGCTSPAVSPTKAPASPQPTIAPTVTVPPTKPPQVTPSPQPVKLVYWDWFPKSEGAYVDEQLHKFHETYPWVTVERNNIPDSMAYVEAIKLTFDTDQAPDVFQLLRRTRLRDYQQYVMPLNKWVTPEWAKRFPSGTFSEGSPNVAGENIYSFPFQGPGNVIRLLYLNTALFEKAGLVDSAGKPAAPKTYSQVREYALKITQACKGECYGWGFGGKDPGNAFGNVIDIAQYGGGSFFTLDGFDFKTGKYAYGSNPAYSDVISLLLGMKEDGSIIPEAMSLDDATIEALFAEGKVAMLLGKFSVATNWVKPYPNFDEFEIVAPPVPDSGQKGFWYYIPGGNTWHMSANTKYPEEVWLLMDWFASKQFAEGWVEAELGVVFYAEANKPEYVKNRHFADFVKFSSGLVKLGPSYSIRNPATSAVKPEAVSPDWADVFAGIYTGQLDMKTALAELDKRKQATLESAIQKAQADGAEVSIEDFIFSDWNQMEDYVTQPNK